MVADMNPLWWRLRNAAEWMEKASEEMGNGAEKMNGKAVRGYAMNAIDDLQAFVGLMDEEGGNGE